MAFSTGSRINTNVTAFNTLNALNTVNRELGVHQLRLASGKKINSAADDASGYVISKKMEGRIRALGMALDNVGDAQSVLGVAEGALQSIADTLIQIKEKEARMNNGAMGEDETDAIQNEIDELYTEIDDIAGQTMFNGIALLDGNFDAEFQVGETSEEVFGLSFDAFASGDLGTDDVDGALVTVNEQIGKIGALINRLSTKEANLTTAITNTEAAKSRILDADVAKEQIASVKLQFLQQTATAQLAQANASPQVFLSLFR